MPSGLPGNLSPTVRARDAALRRLRRLTVGAAVFGAAGTVALGGAAAVNDPGRAVPTNAPVAQPGPVDQGSAPTVPPLTGGSTTGSGQRHHRGATALTPGPVPPVVSGGQPGSGLVTSGGS